MGGFCGGGSSSSSRQSDTDRAVSQAVNDGGTRTYTAGLRDDLTMGLSTIGLNKRDQVAKLSSMGYSDSAIEDYQYRTAQTQERNRPPPPSDDNDRPAREIPPQPPVIVDPEPEVEVTPEPEITPPPPPPPVGDTSVSYDPGPAETAVIEKAEEKTGQAGTIKTSSKGLTTTAKTRRRRSMISGEELEEGLLN